ncbi:hypothetical protein D3C81_2112900 [compost metagenome]
MVDGRTENLRPQLLAQPRYHVLANVVGTDVGEDRAQQRQRAEAAEGQQHASAGTALGVQGMVYGRQQSRDAHSAKDTQQG